MKKKITVSILELIPSGILKIPKKMSKSMPMTMATTCFETVTYSTTASTSMSFLENRSGGQRKQKLMPLLKRVIAT